MQSKRGFTLVELIVVVSIIVIIVAIAIPNLTRYRMSANDRSALASSRQIATAQVAFKASTLFDSDSDGEGDYGNLAQLADPDGAGTKGGYTFTMNITLGDVIDTPGYSCLATPVPPGHSGQRQYFVDDSGRLRSTLDGPPAGPASRVI